MSEMVKEFFGSDTVVFGWIDSAGEDDDFFCTFPGGFGRMILAPTLGALAGIMTRTLTLSSVDSVSSDEPLDDTGLDPSLSVLSEFMSTAGCSEVVEAFE